jgi:hypothetical protein
MTTTIVDEVIDTPANYYTYYTFSVPAGASSARVTGTYEMHGGGLIPLGCLDYILYVSN